jgi:hypothetical protein
MEEYLAKLPRGLDSYPDYQQKAVGYREFLAEVPANEMSALRVLPGPLLDLVERLVPVSNWIPEVHSCALFLAIADLYLESEELYLARKLELNRRILRSPLYRVLFLFVTPQGLLGRDLPARWNKFHRGLLLRAVEVGAISAKLRMEFPHHLVPVLQIRAYAGAVQAAVEASGGRGVFVEIASSSSTHAVFEASWAQR